jgi:hypothetical protein
VRGEIYFQKGLHRDEILRLDSWGVGSAMAVERIEGKVRWVSAKPRQETICHVCWLDCHKSACRIEIRTCRGE